MHPFYVMDVEFSAAIIAEVAFQFRCVFSASFEHHVSSNKQQD